VTSLLGRQAAPDGDELEDDARSSAQLPKLAAGIRKWHLAGLLACGLLTAALAGASAWSTHTAMSANEQGGTSWLVIVILGAALGLGAVRALERVLAEHLGQHYIHQIRVLLIESALRGSGKTSPGVIIARTTNDLTAVRNWVALGIAPLIVAVPLIIGVGIVLALIHPAMAFALLMVCSIMVAIFAAVSGVVFERARTVRRMRGRLAAATSDTVNALESIRTNGGENRERNSIDRIGSKVVAAAIHRSRASGLLRGTAAAAAALATAVVVVLGVFGTATAAQVTSALLVVGIIVTPLNDLGRVVEYRQNFKAARRVLLPALEQPPVDERTREFDAELGWADEDGFYTFEARDLVLADDTHVPTMLARAGNRIRIEAEDPGAVRELLEAVTGIGRNRAGVVRISGIDMSQAEGGVRRRVLGLARGSDLLPRGTLDRAIRYRHPGSSPSDAAPIIGQLGLDEVIATLPRQEKTLLRRGGEPLTESQRGLVHLARAVFGTPEVLVIDRLLEALDEQARKRVDALVAGYPGVVITTESGLSGSWRRWVI
jgi:ABC-type multidrug transport system fused ATPase/permease subunit